MKIKLKDICNQRGISLYRLAILMDKPQQTIYSWAKGRTQISYLSIEKICQILNCSISDILEPEIYRGVI